MVDERARPLPADDRALPRQRPAPRRHLPPLHDSALGRGGRWLGQPGDRRPVRPVLRAGRRPPRRRDRHGVHDQRAERGLADRVPARRVPARHQRPRPRTTGSTRTSRPRTARATTRSSRGPGDFPTRVVRRDGRLVVAGGLREDARRLPPHARGPAPRSGARRRLHRRAGLLPHPARPSTASRSAPRRASRTLDMGYEYWPQALEAAIRHAAEVTGCPIYVTENGIGTTDDEQRIRYVTDALGGVRPLPRRRHRRPRLLLLVAPGQLRVGLRLPAAVRARGRRPGDPGPDAQAQRRPGSAASPGPTGSTDPSSQRPAAPTTSQSDNTMHHRNPRL